jgi:cytochrome P450
MTEARPNYTEDQVKQDPYTLPLAEINVANPYLFAHDVHWPWFKRLREEAPVHYCAESFFGPYWSVTRYDDIMTVDTSHDVYSSEPAIVIRDPQEDLPLPMFIAMDRPKHDEQRKVVAPVGRSFQLGGQGIHRAHHPHAGHPVRFPLRGSQQADLLV